MDGTPESLFSLQQPHQSRSILQALISAADDVRYGRSPINCPQKVGQCGVQTVGADLADLGRVDAGVAGLRGMTALDHQVERGWQQFYGNGNQLGRLSF